MGTFVRNLSIRNFRCAFFALGLPLGIFRWDLSLGHFSSNTLVWELSLGNARLEPFAGELGLGGLGKPAAGTRGTGGDMTQLPALYEAE